MSCVRILAQHSMEYGVRAKYRRCSYLAGCLCLGVGRRVFGDIADEAIQTHAKVGAGITWMSDEGVQKVKQELLILVATSTSYWVSNITYIPSIRSLPLVAVRRALLAREVSG